MTGTGRLCAQARLALAMTAIAGCQLIPSAITAQSRQSSSGSVEHNAGGGNAGSLGSPCSRLKVQSKVVEKPKVGKRTIFDGEALVGVSGVIQYSITYDGKPLANVQIHEDNTVHTTLNGQPEQEPLRQNDIPTDANGQIGDLFGQLRPLGTHKENKETIQFYEINAFTQTSTNTLTFSIPGGATCTSTTTRTLTNGPGGPDYTITVSRPLVASPAH
jgi:hypothetical protein